MAPLRRGKHPSLIMFIYPKHPQTDGDDDPISSFVAGVLRPFLFAHFTYTHKTHTFSFIQFL